MGIIASQHKELFQFHNIPSIEIGFLLTFVERAPVCDWKPVSSILTFLFVTLCSERSIHFGLLTGENSMKYTLTKFYTIKDGNSPEKTCQISQNKVTRFCFYSKVLTVSDLRPVYVHVLSFIQADREL